MFPGKRREDAKSGMMSLDVYAVEWKKVEVNGRTFSCFSCVEDAAAVFAIDVSLASCKTNRHQLKLVFKFCCAGRNLTPQQEQ